MFAALLLAMGVMLGLGGLSAGGEGGSAEGGDDPEALKGSAQDDEIDGGGGSDLIIGFNGDDLLFGGQGNDWMFGMDGDDSIDAGYDNDVVSGGAGADTIDAGAGDDFVESAGILDEEAMETSAGSARSFGDIAFLYKFDNPADAGDVVSLGDGDDTVVAGGADTVTGGNGADEFALGDWASGEPPVVITDFDPDEDVVTYGFEAGRAEPVFKTVLNPISGDAEIMADNEIFAIIRNAGPEFDPVQIVTRSYSR